MYATSCPVVVHLSISSPTSRTPEIQLGLQHCTERTQKNLSRLLFAHWRAYPLRSGEKVLMRGMFCHFSSWNSWPIFRKLSMNIILLNIISTPNFVFVIQQQRMPIVRTNEWGSTNLVSATFCWVLRCSVVIVGLCHHGVVRPRVADRGTASDKEGSCE